MSIYHLLNALKEANRNNFNASLINQLIAYHPQYHNQSFIVLLRQNRLLFSRCVAALPREVQGDMQRIFVALDLYVANYFEPHYKEHVLQKYVVEGDLVGIAIGLELGVDINTRIGYVPDLTHSQIAQGFLQLFSFKLPTAWTSNWHHCTPLVLASLLGYIDVVKFLAEHGAQLDCETRHHNTALDWATKRGHHRIEKYLLSRGAMRNTTSDQDIEALAGEGLQVLK